MRMLPWSVCPLAGQSIFGQNMSGECIDCSWCLVTLRIVSIHSSLFQVLAFRPPLSIELPARGTPLVTLLFEQPLRISFFACQHTSMSAGGCARKHDITYHQDRGEHGAGAQRPDIAERKKDRLRCGSQHSARVEE